VEDFLELALMEEPAGKPKLEDLDVNTVVSEVADEFQLQAEARQLTFQLEKAKQPLIIRGDPFHMRYAIRNLVDNAIKYTPPGGVICLSVEAQGQEVLVRIQDTGYGMPPDDLPYIFDRFYRVRSPEVVQTPGSGLGLAIVKSIVERHHGHVEVESDYGKGSCFMVYLPMIEIPLEIKEKSAPLEK
jgi:two-component system phosphate regulon sensor histidine kinase PhoR